MMLVILAISGIAGFFRKWLVFTIIVVASVAVQTIFVAPKIAENRRLLGLTAVDPAYAALIALAQTAIVALVGFLIGSGVRWFLTKRNISN